MSEIEDDIPQLSMVALTALREFYEERAQKEIKLRCVLEGGENDLQKITISEDWQLSQFWYDDKTALYLAREALRIAEPGSKIALVSCPTLYKTLKTEAPNIQERKDRSREKALQEIKKENTNQESNLSPPAYEKVTLFEFDERFVIYGEDFILYDYKSPLDIPHHLAGSYDIVIADPPFLSEECLTKTAVTIKFLAKDKIILCTGANMEELASRLLDLKICEFRPQHKNNLANEFCCYTNYDMHNEMS